MDEGTGPAREAVGRVEVYKDRDEKWRWRIVHRNGNILADSGQGYADRRDAWAGLDAVLAILAHRID